MVISSSGSSFSNTFSSMSDLSVCNYPQVKDQRCPSEPSCLRAHISKKSPVWISSSFQSQTFGNAGTSLVCLVVFLKAGFYEARMSAKCQIVTLLSFYIVLLAHQPNSVRHCNLMLNHATKRSMF